MGSMRSRLAVVLIPLGMLLMGACGGDDAADGGVETDTVSATEYATGVCRAIAGWVDDIQGLNQDLQANLDPSSIGGLKDAMVGFLEDVTTATDDVIGEVEAVGIPDVDDGEAAADAVLAALRDSRAVFDDARDRAQGLSTADPAAFAEELQTLGTDIQSSMSGIGSELDQFGSPELDEASKDIPECQEVAAAA
jgi:hypothetical protein